MLTEQRAVAALRIFLIVLLGILVVFQTLSMPGQFAHMAKEDPDSAYLRWPLTVIAVFLIFCIQVVVISTWKLLTLVKDDRIFSEASMKWVDAIVGAITAAWLVLLGIFLFVGINADDPGAPMLLFFLLVGVAVVGLLMVVMRALLRQATTLRTDMETVI